MSKFEIGKKSCDNEKMIDLMKGYREIFWLNPGVNSEECNETPPAVTVNDIDEAEARLIRFAPYIAKVFPETAKTAGIIESPLTEVPELKKALNADEKQELAGSLYLKCDSHLPISGSIKARGGIYEVLKLAEKLAVEAGLLSYDDDYAVLAEDRFKEFFSQYSVAVGSTGNLGLSIGIISAKLGFKVTVHMSADAREWKKALLREKGAIVTEYEDDYGKAVEEGRALAAKDPKCHFVDDEASVDLFLGYAVAGRRLAKQLKEKNISVDNEHPLYVYIPCGVGGAPGGVVFGLKEIFGEDVHCFFAEPTHAPCMTLGLLTGLHSKISVKDIGLDGVTAADGLAVSRPSALVGRLMETRLQGCFTADDERLYPYLNKLYEGDGIFVEPSACATFRGPYLVEKVYGDMGKKELKKATHILWATGGSMVPEDEKRSYLNLR
ncbi:MAG: D-serine ammonia-lyase [Peptostreptococcaceae bacterium]|nr:D-serine ammonia-lyase [Peptostreptococcaceae bacterium]MDY5738789.1 D-serine ammonia-lyase [Anaerovoracaceae bacterium]